MTTEPTMLHVWLAHHQRELSRLQEALASETRYDEALRIRNDIDRRQRAIASLEREQAT